ncbi:MAG: endonuclease III [Planctomycetes bacterium]|nr:endonuclease III [Planctomycetota bacterium]
MNIRIITQNNTANKQILPIIRTLIKFHKDSYTPVSRQADPYKVLVSCIISQRTRDEQTDKVSARLFNVASTPAEMAELPVRRLEKLLVGAGFYRTKARHIIAASKILLEQHGGKMPDEFDELMKLPGVGRKTANIVMVFGFGRPAIPVDTHVHRISNRLGIVRTKTPEETEFALIKIVPRRYWLALNAVMVRHGQTICRPVSPKCPECPAERMCMKRNL